MFDVEESATLVVQSGAELDEQDGEVIGYVL